MAKLILDDEGFEILGNALLLGYSVRMIQRQNGLVGEQDGLEDRIESSEARELRDVLERAGAHDRRLTGSIDANGAFPAAEFASVFERWVNLANSDADIANLRLRGIDFISYLPEGNELLKALKNTDAFELRTPLAKLGPTKLTSLVTKMVLDYYNGDFGTVCVVSGSVENQETNPQKDNHSRVGFGDEDRPFVQLALRVLESGRAKNANRAVVLIESGLWKEVEPEAGSFEAAVAGNGTYGSKRTRLYKQVNAIWKARSTERPKYLK
ncbi:hypothetical protein [Sulfitobacter mediterraneus]|uniref:hypothetical protein n=1 Tax=Sulfitobacter mediterraneus TaxID=83219 RepID=UPI0021A65F13|nr:hypothetical protein [Sulfitobacter mediterraneus]UWR12419.1 hypothetical protein K3753_06025 [Sulfitobacter mediterraneus]